MATYTIGPVASTGTSGAFYQGKVVLNTTTNNSGNYTDVAWEFRIWANTTAQSPSNYRFQNGNQVLVVIDGQTVLNTANIGLVALSGTTAANNVLLASGSIRVYHNTDGTKQLAVNARYYQPNAPVLNTINPVGTVTLPKIVRAAVIDSCPDITLTSASNTNHTITWDDVRDYYYKVQYLYGDTVLHTSSVISPGTESYTWAVPRSIVEEEPNSKTMKITVRLRTYTDSSAASEVGSNDAKFTATMDSSFSPNITNTFQIDHDTVGFECVAGKSYSQMNWENRYVYGATFASGYAVYVDSNGNEVGARVYGNTTPVTLGVLPNFSDTSKTFAVKISTTDSRGFTDEEINTPFTVYGWSAPSISAVTAFRCDANETPNLSGGYYDVSFTYSIRSLNNGNAKNAKISYKYASDNSWTQSASGALANYSGTLNMGPYTLSQARDEKLEIKVELTDSLSSDNPTTITFTILPAEVFLDMITNADDVTIHEGLGIGRINNKRFTVQSAWPLEIYDDDGNLRVVLDDTDGLRFYNASGVLTQDIPVVEQIITSAEIDDIIDSIS